MMNPTQQEYDAVCEQYRSRFPYLNDRQFESLTLIAGENTYDIDDEEKAFHVFGMTLESMAQYPEHEILEII